MARVAPSSNAAEETHTQAGCQLRYCFMLCMADRARRQGQAATERWLGSVVLPGQGER